MYMYMYIYVYIYIYIYISILSLLRRYSRANRGKTQKGVPLLLPQQFLDNLDHILIFSIRNIKNVPNFIRISISGMKKS